LAEERGVTAAAFGPLYPDLQEAVAIVSANRGRSDARTFGRWLARNKGRIAAGYRLQGTGDAHGHAMRWWIESCG
jgi:hypothetical protein